LDEAFAAHVRQSPEFAIWLLGRTKFAAAEAALDLAEPWQFRWYRSPETGLESETDIFLRFEPPEGSAFALHIENKVANGSFRKGQAATYRTRAADQRQRWRYDDFCVVLIAPLSFRDRFPSECAKFDAFISHEEIAEHIPIFAAMT
jgi:hypothetical protein